MTSRALQKDTEADRELYSCLNSLPPRSFLMVAGAGSGKTTSLIKGLTEIINQHAERLKLRRQKIACITYTEIAAGEIWADVGKNPLVHVSTIHSFLWFLVRSFQSDIRAWVAKRIDEKLEELRKASMNFGPRVQQRTRDKNKIDIDRYDQQRNQIGKVRSFTYGTGSDYVNGILGHDDIIKMVPQFILERPLMRRLLIQQYPFLFVDESQDTTENVVDALKAVDRELGDQFCLGFFGDPMQRIYLTGIGEISIGLGWSQITKPENFRCPSPILSVANAIRRDGDGLIQIQGRVAETEDNLHAMDGSAHIFILPNDEKRDQRIIQVRSWTAKKNDDPIWYTDEGNKGVKLLVIVHRMAAKRLGFGDLYSALNDKAPEKFKNGFLDGTTWPVYPFINFVLPLINASKKGNEFDVIQLLRNQSPLLSRDTLSKINVEERLSELRRFTESLQEMMEVGSDVTNADVLRFIHESNVVNLDPRVLSYLKLPSPAKVENGGNPIVTENENDGEDLSKEIAAMDAFLRCPASQFWGYYKYLNNDSPFSTQQGIKGAEFERVLVILDDDEGTHVQFSYDKYLGIKALSDKDLENRREGKETVIERTRRLFYVCCTRALKDLIVVLFTTDVVLAKHKIAELKLFPSDAIHLQEEIEDI
ncbi:UvrD-helicase domain-containing protein [Leptospirillum ferriphilum]|uniref:UvrD-helicase domain-containing protein n=1 Tax=Leptospirillum ferriphilum TaxID=178606 RepID=UPI0006B15691|nr:UvrD-helicase domain-containing protein [Leptospirillum ferriphilum]